MDERRAHHNRNRRGVGDRAPATPRHAAKSSDDLGRRVGDDLYVRSWRGRTGAWFRGAQVRQKGHTRAGGIEKEVQFADADRALYDHIDEGYRTKYRRYGA